MPVTPTATNNLHPFDEGGTPPPAKRQRMTKSQQPPASPRNTTTAKELYGAAVRDSTSPPTAPKRPVAKEGANEFPTRVGIIENVASLKYGKPVDTVRSKSSEILVYQDKNTGQTFTHVDKHTGKPSVMGTPDAVTVANYIFLNAYVDKQTLEFRQKGDTNAVTVQTYINKNTYVDRYTCIECAADAPNAVTRYEYNRLQTNRKSVTARPDNQTVTLNVARPSAPQNHPVAKEGANEFPTMAGIIQNVASLKYGKPVDEVRSGVNTVLVYQDENTGQTFTHVDKHTGKPAVMGTPDAVTVARYIYKYSYYVDKQTLEPRQKGDANAVIVQTYINNNTYVDRETGKECAADAPNAVTRQEYIMLQKRKRKSVAASRPDNQTVTLNVARPSAPQNHPVSYRNEGLESLSADGVYQGDDFDPIPLNQINDYASFWQSDFGSALPGTANTQQATLPLQPEHVWGERAGVPEDTNGAIGEAHNNQHMKPRASSRPNIYPDEVMVTYTAASPPTAPKRPVAKEGANEFPTMAGIIQNVASLKYGKPVDEVRSGVNTVLVYQNKNTGKKFTHLSKKTGKPADRGTPDAVTVAKYIWNRAYVDKQTLEFRQKGDANAVTVKTYINKNTYVDRYTCIECAADAPNAVTRYEYNRLQKRKRKSVAASRPDNQTVTLNVARPSAPHNQATTEKLQFDGFMSADRDDNAGLEIDDTELGNFLSEWIAEQETVDPHAGDPAIRNLDDVATQAQIEADNLDRLLRDL